MTTGHASHDENAGMGVNLQAATNVKLKADLSFINPTNRLYGYQLIAMTGGMYPTASTLVPAGGSYGFNVTVDADAGTSDPGTTFNVTGITSVNSATWGALVTTINSQLGGSGSLTLTAAPASGAMSATLTAVWAGQTTVTQNVTFSNGDVRAVTFKNGSAAITWTTGLSTTATTAITTFVPRAWAQLWDTGNLRINSCSNGSKGSVSTDMSLNYVLSAPATATATGVALTQTYTVTTGGNPVVRTLNLIANTTSGSPNIVVTSVTTTPGGNAWVPLLSTSTISGSTISAISLTGAGIPAGASILSTTSLFASGGLGGGLRYSSAISYTAHAQNTYLQLGLLSQCPDAVIDVSATLPAGNSTWRVGGTYDSSSSGPPAFTYTATNGWYIRGITSRRMVLKGHLKLSGDSLPPIIQQDAFVTTSDLTIGQEEGNLVPGYTPAIYLFQTGNPASALTFTAAPAAAATSGTLSTAWTGTTGLFNITFSTGDVRPVQLTAGSTTAIWVTGLSAVATTAATVLVPLGSLALGAGTRIYGTTTASLIYLNGPDRLDKVMVDNGVDITGMNGTYPNGVKVHPLETNFAQYVNHYQLGMVPTLEHRQSILASVLAGNTTVVVPLTAVPSIPVGVAAGGGSLSVGDIDLAKCLKIYPIGGSGWGSNANWWVTPTVGDPTSFTIHTTSAPTTGNSFNFSCSIDTGRKV